MSKNIAISDDVYRRLKREKDGRSFSEVIAETLDSGGTIAEVAGMGIFEEGIHEDVKASVRDLSSGTVTRLAGDSTADDPRE